MARRPVMSDELQMAVDELRADMQRDMKEAITARPTIQTSRLEGNEPFVLTEVGGERRLKQATGGLDPGDEQVMYLTRNGQARGDAVYGPMPDVRVFCDVDATPGGLTRASGPPSPNIAVRLKPHDDYQLEWDPANKVWCVRVTNSLSVNTGFLVLSGGVK